jgi:transposase
MRFEDLLDRHEWGQLTQAEAGEMLGMSERSFRRWQVRHREEGAAGLVDRRVGRPSPRRSDAGELARARALYAEMYDGLTVKHFHEKLVERHGDRLGYSVTRLALQASGQVKKAPRRGAHRRKRPRRPLPGMLLHQDAARHGWLAGRPALDLVVTLDDATSALCSASVWQRLSVLSPRGAPATCCRPAPSRPSGPAPARPCPSRRRRACL